MRRRHHALLKAAALTAGLAFGSVGIAGAVADDTGRSRTSLYRALAAGGNPGLDTVMRALNAMGVRLEARAKPRHERMPPQRERMHV